MSSRSKTGRRGLDGLMAALLVIAFVSTQFDFSDSALTGGDIDDLLARTGIRFARHHSQSSWTKTSMAALWTGVYPHRNGILRDTAIPSPTPS